MKTYVSVKVVQAQPMDYGRACLMCNIVPNGRTKMQDDGYLIHYPDGYISWCPKAAFEESSTCIDENRKDEIVSNLRNYLREREKED